MKVKIRKLMFFAKYLLMLTISILTTSQGLAYMQPTSQSKINNPNEMSTVKPYDMQLFDNKINEFYRTINVEDFKNKLRAAATFFLGQPYVWEPLGEGEVGKYYQEPLYRTNQFDCVTFTDTVLALAHSQNLSQFKWNILQIRYAKPFINYIYRTDWFTDLEWLPHAEQIGWLEDVTNKINDKNGKSIAINAATLIDKPNWYKVRPMKSLRLEKSLPKEEAAQLLEELRAEGQAFQAKSSNLAYLPLNILFDDKGKPNPFFFDQIPSESVIVIVRPNWQIRDHLNGFPNGYGTNLNVSHLGISIRTKQGLMFYHASSIKHKVVSLPLTEYLQTYLHSDSVKGIHVEKIK